MEAGRPPIDTPPSVLEGVSDFTDAESLMSCDIWRLSMRVSAGLLVDVSEVAVDARRESCKVERWLSLTFVSPDPGVRSVKVLLDVSDIDDLLPSDETLGWRRVSECF